MSEPLDLHVDLIDDGDGVEKITWTWNNGKPLVTFWMDSVCDQVKEDTYPSYDIEKVRSIYWALKEILTKHNAEMKKSGGGQ